LVWSKSDAAAAGGVKHGETVIMSSDHVANATHGTMRIFKLAMRRTPSLQGGKIQPIGWLSILPTCTMVGDGSTGAECGGQRVETDHIR
jgi:hypothetical protein